MKTEKLLTIVQNALEDKKGKDIKTLDVHKISSFTDFMVIVTGRTARQVSALAQHVIEESKSYGYRPLGDEGSQAGEWALVDLGDIIVHVMQPQTRDFYQLEKLWGEMDNEALLGNEAF